MDETTADLFANQKKLFLLDGMALTYRAHFALVRSPRFTSGGICTSAVFGVLNTVLDIIRREQPTHLAVAFDTKEPTARHTLFPQYKAQREAMPEDIAKQLPLIDRLFEALNIQSIRMPGYEADDIIGTLAHEAQAQGFQTWMVTPDKDYDQLVTNDIFVYKPGRKGGDAEIHGLKEVLGKWQIERVDQVIDVLGLMGDTSDNIPGVPGIGPKTAQKLIAQFGSIEKLYEQIDQLKGKQKETIAANHDNALQSKQLVTIQLDVPHSVDLTSLQWTHYDTPALKSLLTDLEFDAIGKRIFGKAFSAASARASVVREKRETEIQATLFDEPVSEKTIHDVSHEYSIIDSAARRAELIELLLQQPAICFDTETTSLNPSDAVVLGMAFSFEPHKAYYVVCPPSREQAEAVIDEFRPVFESETIEKIGHNLKYDLSVLKWHGFDVRGPLVDTMLAHSIKEPEMRHGLDYLATLYLGYRPIPTSDLIGPKGKNQKNMRDVPVEKLAEYACEDADVTLQVARLLMEGLRQSDVGKVCYEVEFPLVNVLVEMEHEGIRLDSEALANYSGQLAAEIEQLQNQIFASAGHSFNIDSPKQLGLVLYEELRLEANPKKTATGQYSTREAELERLAGKHPIIRDCLEYRNARKLKSVYVDQLPAAVNPKTGRIHTRYDQVWTSTGRIQSNDPNLQTIPVRKQRGREIRAAFVPRDQNHLLLSADYSQIELRVMAELSGDEGLREAFQSGEDIHRVTASKVYKVELEDVTREMRDKAKTVNFGIIYGISSFGLQQRLNIPRAEANELIKNYFDKYPGVQKYMDQTIQFAKDHGYVATLSGRRRYIRDINSQNKSVASAAERLAMNSPIQGTAADMLKLAMIKVHRMLRDGEFKTKMLLTVHDEIVFDMHRSEQETVMPVIEQAMKSAMPMTVPLVVEMGIGQNWLEAH